MNMAKVSEEKVIEVIKNALNQKCLTIDSSSNDVEEWDSLGHLDILVGLDKLFDGKLASIKNMATANSVRVILKILKDNSLI